MTLFLVLLSATSLFAQQRDLTIADIFDAKDRTLFSGAPQSGFVWLDDQTFVWPHTDGRGQLLDFTAVNAVSGASRRFIDIEALQQKVAAIPGVNADEAKALAHEKTLNLDPAKRRVLLTLHDDLYLYSPATDSLERLTSKAGTEEEAHFSPDGSRIAFVRDRNLYSLAIGSGEETQLTRDGLEDRITNGKLDWVYQEEIFGRGIFKGYWWSPDSKSIAYLKLDESPVHEFTIIDHLPYQQDVEKENYPKAGDPNPIARLMIVPAAGGAGSEIDLKSYPVDDRLIVNVDWHPDSQHVVYQVQNREQTFLDLNIAALDGKATRILQERSKAWVENLDNPHWLADGSFLWLSDRSGYRHIYRTSREGKTLQQLTDGPWEVRTIHGVDEKRGLVYFSGTERSPIGSDVYSVRLRGGKTPARLTQRTGTHTATFAPSFSSFLDSWSDVRTPQQVFLVDASGKERRTVDANRVPELDKLRLGETSFLKVPARDGFVMEAMMIKPPGFDPSHHYPVYQHTYAGPHAQQVLDAWRGEMGMFHQLLAEKGVIVWICDNRTASGKGMVSTWPLYQNFGELELRDIEDGLAYLKKLGYVDSSRVMLSGWSYGGFMTSYALTHSSSFVAGIAGGSVTDWRDYDTVYTERYMRTPQNNPDGYRKSSPRFSAANLHGNLLLVHGTTDDNVHIQNTIQFAYELQKAGKQFDMMLYAKSRHGITERPLITHYRTMMLDFIMKNLKPGS